MKSKTKSSYLLEEYKEIIRDILIDFQFIEESLRMYLCYCYGYIAKRLSDTIPFRFNYKDVEKDALGTLINKFAKFNDNTSLISELRELTKHRNECAHRGFLLTSKESHDEPRLEKKLIKLKETEDRTKQCLSTLFSEGKKIEKLLRSYLLTVVVGRVSPRQGRGDTRHP
jgi:hypothetical protein